MTSQADTPAASNAPHQPHQQDQIAGADQSDQPNRPIRPVRYVMGVDTGGTCTDAVLVDAATRRVVASAKRPTIHHDLGRGMAGAMAAALAASGLPASAVDLVSVSTTLATNAVVEGQGAEVGLFIIGYAGRITVPCASMDVIPGGHKLDGSEEEPLALNRLVDSIRLMQNRVDAYAVCGMMSFVNPAHELVAERAIGMVDPKPVFCSHLASSRAGMKERAATAVLNARLLPVMRRFLDGVRTALAGLGIAAPVVVVRGDATAMPMDAALRNASATVASGPAAMAGYGAAHAAGRLPNGNDDAGRLPDGNGDAERAGGKEHAIPAGANAAKDAAAPATAPNTSPDASADTDTPPPPDALIVDVGGTTTDVTLLRRGRPVIQADGMVVGDWETHVEAVEMFTVGVGGDSLVRPDADGTLSVGPLRVVPLCMAGPLPDPAQWLRAGGRARCICPARREDACDEKEGAAPSASSAPSAQSAPSAPSGPFADAAERAVLDHLNAHGPTPAGDLLRALRLPESTLERAIDRLVRQRAVQVAGFTPTDALHVLGLLDLSDVPDLPPGAGNTAAALAGARALAALLPPVAGGEDVRAKDARGDAGAGAETAAASATVPDALHTPPNTPPNTPRDAARAVLAAASQRIEDAVVQHVARREVGGNFAAYLAQRHRHALLRVNVSLGVPMVGIGAASRHLLPAVARALGTTVTFPARYDVGNALGGGPAGAG
ncbi:hydantoinase/oxoprolinase N-terminal domain-containing protein [Nitratidesulfovibrio liaohensis]|uniref:Hydantoinase/oxoprolinase family protein n=1 Tax=Nitratidesulfovibrio liaohensis TaxID=2604158 RepID=A0ABY9R130_9BACT|nr:hydantoinase/oxoprolinase N-terminal domain-containing protein [Nitratidesulfovibrio liaohensis]WMW64469.1 hydantoinase/oxoprolinase family protein [Nitratidesulfovibrio liaohensis]